MTTSTELRRSMLSDTIDDASRVDSRNEMRVSASSRLGYIDGDGADVDIVDDSSIVAELSHFDCRHLTEIVVEGVAFGAIQPSHLIHVVVVVVAR